MSRFLDRYVWWHRLRHHDVSGAGVGGIGVVGRDCWSCGVQWRRGTCGDINVYIPEAEAGTNP